MRTMESRHRPEPLQHPNLLVVGDYLFDSTLNGVLDSADFAAEWLAGEMEHRSRVGYDLIGNSCTPHAPREDRLHAEREEYGSDRSRRRQKGGPRQDGYQ